MLSAGIRNNLDLILIKCVCLCPPSAHSKQLQIFFSSFFFMKCITFLCVNIPSHSFHSVCGDQSRNKLIPARKASLLTLRVKKKCVSFLSPYGFKAKLCCSAACRRCSESAGSHREAITAQIDCDPPPSPFFSLCSLSNPCAMRKSRSFILPVKE